LMSGELTLLLKDVCEALGGDTAERKAA
jgi:hypothetical protein